MRKPRGPRPGSWLRGLGTQGHLPGWAWVLPSQDLYDALTFYLLFLFSIFVSILLPKGFPGGLAVKNLPAIQELEETWVHSLDQEDPLEKGMATHFCLAGYSPWDRKELDTTEASSHTCFSPNEKVLCLGAQPCPTLQTESTYFLSSFFDYSHHKAFC